MRQIPLLTVLTLLVFAAPSWAQYIGVPTNLEHWQPVMEGWEERLLEAGGQVGPVVSVGAPVVAVEDPALPPPIDHEFKIYLDSPNMLSPDQPAQLMGAVPRFINMHVEAGVPLENIKLAVVLHATATEAALGHEEYRARHGIDNPNLPLFEALSEVGVKFYVCGQSAVAVGLTKENKAEQVEIVLSAMTAIAVLQSQGYTPLF